MPFESANPPIAALGEDGALTWANWSFLDMFGQDAVGRDVRDVVTDLDPAFFHKALESHAPKRGRFERKQGARPRLYEAHVFFEGSQRGLVIRDETRVVERDLIVRTFTKKLEVVNRRLTASAARMQLILDHATNGFFALDRHGRVLPEMSRCVTDLMGCDPTGRTLDGLLPGQNGEAIAQLVGLALAGTIPEVLLRESLDFDWLVGGRVLRLELELVTDLDEAAVFAVIHDVTEVRKEQRAEAARAEHHALVWAAAHHPEHFAAAATEARNFALELRRLRALAPAELGAPEIQHSLMIMLHTGKAVVGSFGAERLSAALHDLESAAKERVDLELLVEVSDTVESIVRELDSIVSLLHLEQRVDRVGVDVHELRSLADQLADRPGSGAVARRLRALSLIPLSDGVGDLETVARAAARDRGKEVELRWTDDGVRIDRKRLRGLLHVLPHLVRNSVVHGIESPELRVLRSKPAAGSIVVTARVGDRHLRITIEDDGGGVDRRALAAKLRERGLDLPLDTDADVLVALCMPNLSTAQLTDQHAGRGVGLSAVADEVAALDGTLTLESRAELGSKFVVTLPIDADDPIAALAA